jgi:hypothetical protein
MLKEKGVLTVDVNIKSLRMLLRMSLTYFTFKQCYITVSLFFVSEHLFKLVLHFVFRHECDVAVSGMLFFHSDAIFSLS